MGEEEKIEKVRTTAGPRARRTPYELVFTEGEFESVIFPRIAREAIETDVDPGEPERFEFLSIAADVVREVTPEESPPEALDQYRLLLFHAFNLWRAGKPLYVLDAAVTRFLVESSGNLEGWTFAVPADSLYLQLPPNLFWSSISPQTPPEPIDGFFLSRSFRSNHRDELLPHLEVLVVLGIHRSRAGFSVIPLRTEIDEAAMSEVLSAPPRDGGDFSNQLPGGEISGLYSIMTTGEVLKLVSRALAYIDRNPDGLVAIGAETPAATGEPPSTHLSHTLVTLDASRIDRGS